MTQIDLSKLKQHLAASFQCAHTDVQVSKQAAVLVPLVQVGVDWSLLFIRRAESEADAHSGQVAFPGGKFEENETGQQAAVREAEEEIALQRQHVQILGCLPGFMSVTGYSVQPVIACAPWPYPFALQQQEVSRVFTIPISWLSDSSHYYSESRLVNGESREVIYYQEYCGERLWGLTAAIVQALLAEIDKMMTER